MFELRLLGTVDLRRADGGPVQSVVVQPKRMALLAYLAAARPRGPHRRDVLLPLLWPELDAERGRAALSKALHHLRASLGAEAIAGRGDDAIELDRHRISSDVDRFEEALDEGRHAEALDLWGGDLLAGFFAADATGFERWVDAEQMRLRQRASEAAETLAEEAEGAGDLAAAVGWARRGVALDPLDEPAHRRLIRLLDATGDRAGALATWSRLEARLEEDLGVAPSPESRALVEAIRTRNEAVTTSAEVAAASGEAAATSGEAAATSGEAANSSDSPRRGPPPALSSTSGRWPTLAPGLGLAGLMAVLLGALFVWGGGRDTAGGGEEPGVANRVLVLPFENRTLDPALDPLGRMAADWITDGVSRTGVLEVVPTTLSWNADAPGDAGIRTLAQETGAGIIVIGSFYREGETLHLQAQALDAGSGMVLRPVGSVATPLDAPVSGIDALRTRVLAALAPVVDTVHHLRMAAPPPSFEAYRAYLEGMQAFVIGDPATARRLYLEAAGADPGWPMPRLAAAIMYQNLGDLSAADTLLAALDDSRERLGPLERHTLDFAMAVLRGDWGAVLVAMEAAARIAPGTINEYMVGEANRRLNRPTLAIEALEALGPDRGELRGWFPYWRELALSWGMLGRHDQALKAALEARARHPGDLAALELELRARASLGDVEGVRRLIDERLSSPREGIPSAGWLMELAANALEAQGEDAQSAEFRARALAWYESRPKSSPQSPSNRLAMARILRHSDRPADALDILRPLMDERPDDPIVAGELGVTLARLGEAEEALVYARLAGQWIPVEGRSGPINTLQGRHTLRRAAIHAWLDDPDEAVALLLQARGEGISFGPWIAEDPDLAPLRGHPGYRAWIAPD